MGTLKLTMTAYAPLEHLQGRTAQLIAAVPLRLNRQSVVLRLASVVLLSALVGCSSAPPVGPESDARRAAQERYAKAKALFEERCKTAGVVIKRTVKDVEGIELLKVRPVLAWGDKRYFDPMFDGAAMADEVQGEGYVWSFLRSESRSKHYKEDERGGLVRPERPLGIEDLPMRRGYRFVEVSDPASQQRVRYVVPWNPKAAEYEGLTQVSAGHVPQRYAVDYEDIVNPLDRAYWIAGTRVKVIDQQTGEVIGQLTRYVWDTGFGGSSTGRWPWQHASSRASNQCPSFLGTRSHETRFFVDKVLQPKQDE